MMRRHDGVASLVVFCGVLVIAGCQTPERRETSPMWQETRTQVALQLADEHIRNGKFDRARGLLAAQAAVPDERVQLRLARIDLEEGQYDSAAARLDGVPLEGRESLAWQTIAAVAYEGLGRWPASATAYERVFRLEPTGPRLAAWLDALVLNDETARATLVLAQERDQFPGDTTVQQAAARLFVRLDDHDAAARELSAALLQEPESKALKCELARTYMSAQQYREAIPLWAAVIEATTDAHERQAQRRELAGCQLAAGLYDDAIATYRVLTLTNPSDSAAYAGITSALVAVGRPGEAVSAARAGLRIAPADSDIQTALACAYAKLGQFDDAADALAHAVPTEKDAALVREMVAHWRAAHVQPAK